MGKELSIVIPVYNVEDYVEKCINSVLKIESIDFEIIIVNDGSNDKSGNICKEISENHEKRVKYIIQENQGLSEARNTGIKNSNGEYIYFLDSDDYIDADKFCEVFEDVKKYKPDVTFFGTYVESENVKKIYHSYISESGIYKADEMLKHELNNRTLPAAVCFGIYKRSIIVNNNLFFMKGILHEDERWSPLFLLCTEKIMVSNQVVYHYLQRENSIMHKKDKTQNGIDMVQTAEYLEDTINLINDCDLRNAFRNRQAMLYMKGTVLGRLHRLNYRKYINRRFPMEHAMTKYDKFKGYLFFISPTLYYLFAKFVKG